MIGINIHYCINNNAVIGLKNILLEKDSCPRGMKKTTYLLSLSNSYQPSPELTDDSICYDYCNNSGAYYPD